MAPDRTASAQAGEGGTAAQDGLRSAINTLRYRVRYGCEWRMLFHTIHDFPLMLDRLCNEHEVLPSASVVDSQGVKAPGARARGYDANKKLSGRNRHLPLIRMGVCWQSTGRLPILLTPPEHNWCSMVWCGAGRGSSTCSGMQGIDPRKLLDKAALLEFTVEVVRHLEG